MGCFGVTICRCGRIVSQDPDYYQLVRRYLKPTIRCRGYETVLTLCSDCVKDLIGEA
jgi:hypothetical protein